MGQFLDDVIFGVEVIFYQKAPLFFLQKSFVWVYFDIKKFSRVVSQICEFELERCYEWGAFLRGVLSNVSSNDTFG